MNELELTPIPPPKEEESENFDRPDGSKWIVAIDMDGNVSILQAPNIHWGFFDNGNSAEMLGLPFEGQNEEPGVYEWTCGFVESRDWESGVVDDWGFEVVKSTKLYSLPESES